MLTFCPNCRVVKLSPQSPDILGPAKWDNTTNTWAFALPKTITEQLCFECDRDITRANEPTRS